MQLFVMSIFKRDTHRPSGVKEWQIPAFAAEPMVPFGPCLVEPEEEQDTSYLAASARIDSFSMRFINVLPKIYI